MDSIPYETAHDAYESECDTYETPRERGFNPDLSLFSPTAYRGDSPPRQDIIAGRLPRGKVVILAGEGDIGKSWILLELHRAINDGAADYAFGGMIVRKGLPSIYLSGEDDRVTLDNRLRTIRTQCRGAVAEHGLLVPAPDLGQMALVRQDFDGTVMPTEVYHWLDRVLEAQRAAYGDLGFVAVDTWSTFFPIDANDNARVQAAITLMARLATKHDVCVIITHHMSKGADQSTRAAIRGATALVDGSRAAYCFFRAKPDEADYVHAALEDSEMHPGEVVKLKIVKNNLGLRRDDITYVRQEDGRLLDVSALLRDSTNPADALAALVADYNKDGVRVTKSGKAGLYASRGNDWPPCLFKMGKHKLEALADQLIGTGKLIDDGKQGLLAP